MRGKFIVIEGGDGAGKDTQIELLRRDFGENGFTYTRDPGGTEMGTALRQLLQYDESVAEETELLLFLASRVQLVREVIEPALQEDITVICNRFDLSTYAYQIYGRERRHLADFVKKVSAFARINAVPDLVVLLDVPPEVGLARSALRGEKATRFEQEKLQFHERVREGYLESAKEYPHVAIIDASRSVGDVYQDVKREIENELKS